MCGLQLNRDNVQAILHDGGMFLLLHDGDMFLLLTYACQSPGSLLRESTQQQQGSSSVGMSWQGYWAL